VLVRSPQNSEGSGGENSGGQGPQKARTFVDHGGISQAQIEMSDSDVSEAESDCIVVKSSRLLYQPDSPPFTLPAVGSCAHCVAGAAVPSLELFGFFLSQMNILFFSLAWPLREGCAQAAIQEFKE
jgi:hypothetical protein